MGRDYEFLEAARNGNIAFVEKILLQKSKKGGPLASLRRGPGVNVQDSNGYSALHHAALNGRIDIVKLLLAHDASSNLVDSRGSSPVHLAAWAGHQDIVKVFLTQPANPANVNLQTIEKETPLHCAAQYGHTGALTTLLAHGGDPNMTNCRNETPLDLAAQYGRLQAVQMLIRAHPELLIPYKNSCTRTATDSSTENFGKSSIGTSKISSSPNTNQSGSSVCNSRSSNVSIYSAETISSTNCRKNAELNFHHHHIFPIQSQLTFTHTPLHLASRNGHKNVVVVLLAAGVDVNILTPSGTALHEAALCGKDSVVRTLLDSGADLNATDYKGRTALNILEEFPPHVTRGIVSVINSYTKSLIYDSESDEIQKTNINRAKKSHQKYTTAFSLGSSYEIDRILPTQNYSSSHYDITTSPSSSMGSLGPPSPKYNRTPNYDISPQHYNSLKKSTTQDGADADDYNKQGQQFEGQQADQQYQNHQQEYSISKIFGNSGSYGSIVKQSRKPAAPKKPPRRNLSVSPKRLLPSSSDRNSFTNNVTICLNGNNSVHSTSKIKYLSKFTTPTNEYGYGSKPKIDSITPPSNNAIDCFIFNKKSMDKTMIEKTICQSLCKIGTTNSNLGTGKIDNIRSYSADQCINNFSSLQSSALLLSKLKFENRNTCEITNVSNQSSSQSILKSYNPNRKLKRNRESFERFNIDFNKDKAYYESLNNYPQSPTNYQQPPTPEHPPPTPSQAEKCIYERIHPNNKEYEKGSGLHNSLTIESSTSTSQDGALLSSFKASSGSISSSISISDRSMSTDCVEEYIIENVPFAAFSLNMRMLKSLAYLPPEEVKSYFDELTANFDEDSKKIASWFDHNYIRGLYKGSIINLDNSCLYYSQNTNNLAMSDDNCHNNHHYQYYYNYDCFDDDDQTDLNLQSYYSPHNKAHQIYDRYKVVRSKYSSNQSCQTPPHSLAHRKTPHSPPPRIPRNGQRSQSFSGILEKNYDTSEIDDEDYVDHIDNNYVVIYDDCTDYNYYDYEIEDNDDHSVENNYNHCNYSNVDQFGAIDVHHLLRDVSDGSVSDKNELTDGRESEKQEIKIQNDKKIKQKNDTDVVTSYDVQEQIIQYKIDSDGNTIAANDNEDDKNDTTWSKIAEMMQTFGKNKDKFSGIETLSANISVDTDVRNKAAGETSQQTALAEDFIIGISKNSAIDEAIENSSTNVESLSNTNADKYEQHQYMLSNNAKEKEMGIQTKKTIGCELNQLHNILATWNLLQIENLLIENGYDNMEFMNGIIDEDDLVTMNIPITERPTLLKMVNTLPKSEPLYVLPTPNNILNNNNSNMSTNSNKYNMNNNNNNNVNCNNDSTILTVDQWLNSINLNLYSGDFRKHLYTNMETVCQVWEVELQTILEIKKIGHRKRILNSVSFNRKLPPPKRSTTTIKELSSDLKIIKDQSSTIDIEAQNLTDNEIATTPTITKTSTSSSIKEETNGVTSATSNISVYQMPTSKKNFATFININNTTPHETSTSLITPKIKTINNILSATSTSLTISDAKVSKNLTTGTNQAHPINRHGARKNRPAPKPPINKIQVQQSRPPQLLEIRAPSELLLGLPSNLRTQWRHSAAVLVGTSVKYDVYYLGSTIVKELRGTESTRKSIQKLKRDDQKSSDTQWNTNNVHHSTIKAAKIDIPQSNEDFDKIFVSDKCDTINKLDQQEQQQNKINKDPQQQEKKTSDLRRRPIRLQISHQGVEFIDVEIKKLICVHEIRNINCACQDADDLSHFAYITKDTDNQTYYCHVFNVSSMDLATEIILTLGQAFEIAYQLALQNSVKSSSGGIKLRTQTLRELTKAQYKGQVQQSNFKLIE